MCRRIRCMRCGKPSYEGCGAHIEQVLGDVPKDQRCQCEDDDDEDDANVLSYKVIL